MFAGAVLISSEFLSTPTPPKDNYDELNICSGNSNTITIDEANVLNIYQTKEQALSLTDEQTFGVNNVMLAHFENTLEAGNVSSQNLPVTSWRILRRREGEVNYVLVATVENSSVTFYKDTQIVSGQNYEYAVQSDSNGTRGQIVSGGDAVMATISNWTISDLDGTQIYIINTNVTSSSVKTNVSRTQFEVNSTYPIIHYGQPNFRSGTLKFITRQLVSGSETETEFSPKELINVFDEFINNATTKVLRNSNGLTILVDTTDFEVDIDEQTPVSRDISDGNLYYASFSYTQVGEVDA